MAKKKTYVEIGKRKLELSNLDKVLYPEDEIIKAEIVQYYLQIAPTILRHIKGRPLSLIRFPDGIYGEQFFQKNKPDWTPDWIDSDFLGKEKVKEYVIANEQATLVWLANLACLEIHHTNARKPDLDKPDIFVIDLDPPEDYKFEDLKDLAYEIKEFLEEYDYVPFVKTSGKKGLHITVPIEPFWDYDEVFEAVRDIFQVFIKKNRYTTLNISKQARKGKVLLDIYRNRMSQTTVAAYSLRGVPGGPVSFPITWEDLKELNDPSKIHLRNVLEIVKSEGDAWEAMNAYSRPLHTHRKASSEKETDEIEPSEFYKMPDQLRKYSEKRNFASTPEPLPRLKLGNDNTFVIHRHHASHLHYDLRLEQEGTLKSWAVPRGMPPYPGIKRLAVQTEDHPMEYLTFEGTIPKGQYGGGDMWRFSIGKYTITKTKKNGFYFTLNSPELNADYRIYQTSSKDWLLERVDNPQVNFLTDSIDFMYASKENKVPLGDDYVYEVKWDGIRAMVILDEGVIRILSRNKNDITAQFPEIADPEHFRNVSGVFDGEIVCLDEKGRPSFKNVINRMQTNSEKAIERGVKKNPAVLYLFDCLYIDGRSIINESLIRRKEWLKDSVRRGEIVRISEHMDEGEDLFEAIKKQGMEGIMAKDKSGRYHMGKRSSAWIKVKTQHTSDCYIIGYTKGKGERRNYFGSLHIAEESNGEWVYRGRVGTGFNEKLFKEITGILTSLETVKKPVKEKVMEERNSVWIAPDLICEVKYSSITPNQTFRDPVFIRMRPDLIHSES